MVEALLKEIRDNIREIKDDTKERIDAMDARISKLEDDRNKARAWLAGAGAVGTALLLGWEKIAGFVRSIFDAN